MSLEDIDAKFTVLLPHGISNLTLVHWGRATVGKKMDNSLMYRTTYRIQFSSFHLCMVYLVFSCVYDSYVLLFYRWHWSLIVYWQLSDGASNILFGSLFGACAEPVLKEWSCPLLTLTNMICCIASTLVNCAVSVVHQCDCQCVLAEQETT